MTNLKSTWPVHIQLLRHGQSAGNVALEKAEAQDQETIDIEPRDVDVPLSTLGLEQAAAVGKWMAKQGTRPTVILVSPYVRARQTAEQVIKKMHLKPDEFKLVVDERLREREFGILDRLTRKGILARYPEQAALHQRLKKFYFRPPGGESWTDVILRLRSIQDSLARDYAGEKVLIVCHTVVILCFRYLFERLTEEQILSIDRQSQMSNCGLTTYDFAEVRKMSDLPVLEKFNFAAPIEAAGAEVTDESDVPLEKK